MNIERILFCTLIDVIKFVRSVSNLGMAEAKALAEIWLESFGHDRTSFEVRDFEQVRALCAMVGKVVRNEWTLLVILKKIVTEKDITKSDIINLV